MCDNPDTNPWQVAVDPSLVRRIFPGLLDAVLEKGLEEKIPELRGLSRIDLQTLSESSRKRSMKTESSRENRLVHMEFDIEGLKKLSERELRALLGEKLVPRIINDIKELEIKRPIPDWCYAFF